MSFNASLKKKRKAFKSIFRLDAKKQAIDRDNLTRMKFNFINCNYTPSQSFLSLFQSNNLANMQQRQAWQTKGGQGRDTGGTQEMGKAG